MQNPTTQRPTGVTILAILAIIGGVLALIGGIVLVAAAGAIASGAIATNTGTTSVQITGATAVILGIVAIVTGILYLAFGVGAFRGAGWAWVLGILGALLALIQDIASIVIDTRNGGSAGSAISSNIIGIAISVVILVYLNSARVKAYFGRA